ncbi:unnamed protein product [Alopecurus aequalis]
MVLTASASDHHHRAAKSSPPANPETPSLSKVPAEKSSARAGLLGFSFSWGAHRRLRCSKDGAPVYDSASPSPHPQHPHTPSPEKDKPKAPPPQETPAAGYSSRPQRPRNLRPHRYAASRPDGAGQAALLQSPRPPNPAQAQPRKRGFAVALTAEEIAHDFAAIRRCTTCPVPAARRAKKPTKAVQLAINRMCPGESLSEVDLDKYKIEERV